MSDSVEDQLMEKIHDDLVEVGSRALTMVEMGFLPNTAQEPISNVENAAVNAILRKDPYALDREKTEMRRDENGELAVLPKE